jgi:MFS family permease
MLISIIGTWMQIAAQGWLVYDLTKSPLYLGIVGACGSLPILLFSLPAGVIADRFSKHRIVFITQSLAALQAGLLTLLVYTGIVKVWHVMAMAGMLGVVNAFDMPTRQSMVLDLVERDEIFNAVSLNSSAFNSGRVIGLRAFVFAGMAPLGNLQIGAMAEWLGPRWAVAIDGAICLVAAAMAWWRAPQLRRSE